MSDDRWGIAERVQEACIRAAREAYEDAGIRGLCGEGRWEYTLSALEKIDLGEVLETSRATRDGTGKKSQPPTGG